MDKNNVYKVKITNVQGVESYLSDLTERLFKEYSELVDSNPWNYVHTDGYPPKHLYNKPLLASDGKDNNCWIDYFNGQDCWTSGTEIEYWMEIPKLPTE